MPFLAIVYVDDHTAESMLSSGAPLNELADQGKWVGLFRYPSKNEIGCTGCTINGKNTWSRDPGGFMRCAACGKRNRKIRTFLRNALFDFLGANALPNPPMAFRTPDGYVSLRHKS
jgi:hypothetical protein